MTFSFASDEFVETEGFLVSNVSGRNVFGTQLRRKGNRYKSLLKLMRYKNFMGMFTKIGDTPGGTIFPDGRISKPYNTEDMEKFRRGTELCKKILIGAGCDSSSISVVENIGGHPGGAAAIGRVVDKNLETELKGLYVCDASVFPRSPGRPPTLTIISLAKWFSKRILSGC
jgi:choline dehydrogenase-like flavoprotein